MLRRNKKKKIVSTEEKEKVERGIEGYKVIT